MQLTSRVRSVPRATSLAVVAALMIAACGGDDEPFASSPPNTVAGGDATSAPIDTAPVDTTPAVDPAASPLLDRLMADDAQLTLLVDQLKAGETDPFVIQTGLSAVRDHLFAIDGAVREVAAGTPELADAQVAFLTRLSAFFPAIDEVIVAPPIEVGPGNLADLMRPTLDVQLGLFDLQVALLRASGVAVNAEGDLSGTVVTPELLTATGIAKARLVWDKTTEDDESLCGQPLPSGSPQPLLRQRATFVATEMYGYDVIEVFASDADAAAYMAAYIADTSCLTVDPSVAIIPNDTGWSVADTVRDIPTAFTARQDGNIVYRGVAFVDFPDGVADPLLLGSTVAFAISG
ncbi:MAG: hypothetical protein ABMA25_16310 [Ilumatobacteraceae bacterium]